MATRLAANFVNLVHEATLKSFWRRKALWRFLRQAGVAESFLATWNEAESKRDFLDRLFSKLPNEPRGQELLLSLAQDLAQQESFRDLVGWEDSERKLQDARVAIVALRAALTKIGDSIENERERRRSQERYRKYQDEIRRSRQTLNSLSQRLNDLALKLGSAEAGYEFQRWFYDLMDFFEITSRRPYVSNGRQMDGSVTVSGTTYIVELKFTREQTGAPDVDTILKKIEDKADNTMGIMISISGYSGIAISEASGRRTPLLLMDHRHLYLILGGAVTFDELLDRVRRHASQTGEALLTV
jgi:hypothetical protein